MDATTRFAPVLLYFMLVAAIYMARHTKYFSLPGWAAVHIGMRRKSHPWHGRRFSLELWHMGETPIARDLNFGIWICLAGMIAVLDAIYFVHSIA